MTRIMQQRFHYYFHCFKNIHFHRIMSLQEGLPLPIGAVLHDTNNFVQSNDLVPDLAYWMKLLPYIDYYWVYHNTLMNKSSFTNYQVPDKYRILTMGINSSIMHFRSSNNSVRTIVDINKFDRVRKPILNMVNDRPVLNVKITGPLAPFQLIEHSVNATLDKIYSSPEDLTHYIPIKLGNISYKRTDFVKIFNRGFNLTTISHMHDPIYILLSMLGAYCLFPNNEIMNTPFHTMAKLDKSKIEALSEKEKHNKDAVKTMDERLAFIFHTDKHFFIYSLSDLKLLINESLVNFDKFLSQVTLMVDNADSIANYSPSEEMTKDGIVEKDQEHEQEPIPDPEKEEVTPAGPITEQELKEKAQNYKEPKQPEAKEAQVKTIKTPISVSAPEPTKEAPVVKENKAPVIPESRKNELVVKSVGNNPIIKKIEPPRRKELITHEHPKLKTDEIIDKPTLQFIEEISLKKGYTQAQKERLLSNANAYKALTLGDKSLAQILDETNGLKPNEAKDMSFLSDQVEDPSYLKSSIASINNNYSKTLVERQIVATFAHFNKTGKFLVDFSSEVTSNKLENRTTYSLTYEDSDFKRHSFKVILPNVNPDGTITSRGAVKKIYSQRVNKPICKISPTRVALFSDYYKATVDLVSPVRSSFGGILLNLLIKKNPEKKITFRQGKLLDPDHVYPLELTQAASVLQWMKIGKVLISFDLKNIPYIPEKEVWKIGSSNEGHEVFINMKNQVQVFKNGELKTTSTILDLVSDFLQVGYNQVVQWTEVGIINKNIPIGIVLAYQFGIEKMLEMVGINYDLYDRVGRGRSVPDEVIKKSVMVSFKDKILTFPREPYAKSLIVAGLSKYDLNEYSFYDLNEKDVFYNILIDAKFPSIMTTEIENFFHYFIDPVMYDLLLYMNEPTNPEGLLIRASEMLSTMNHKPSSSVTNFRTRCHGKIPALLYNEIARQMAIAKRNDNSNKKISVNPQAVFQRLVQDALTENADINNPIGAIKDMTTFCYTGFGGRTAETFVVKDRQYPDDGQGIISEATIDSGNVALRAQYCLNPNFANLHGMEEPVDLKDVEAGNLLSISGLLWPGLTISD